MPASGTSLVTINFVSTDALGTFNLVADGTVGLTSYTTFDGVDFNDVAFNNMPPAGLTLGTVTVVPEPSSIMLAILSGLTAFGVIFVRARTYNARPSW